MSVNNKKYRITWSLEFDAMDDPDAREIAHVVNQAITGVDLNGVGFERNISDSLKLQQVFSNKPPRKVLT